MRRNGARRVLGAAAQQRAAATRLADRYYLLEDAGLRVSWSTPRTPGSWPGGPRPRLDAQWIARPTEMGLLRASFVPPPEIRALRDLTRARADLVHYRTRNGSGWRSCWKRPDQAVVGGLEAGRGQRPPAPSSRPSSAASATRPLAGLARPGCAAPRRPERALDGMMFDGHHARLVRIHLDRIDVLDRPSTRWTTRSTPA